MAICFSSLKATASSDSIKKPLSCKDALSTSMNTDNSVDSAAIIEAFATDPSRNFGNPKISEANDRMMREAYENLLKENSSLKSLSFEVWSTIGPYRSVSYAMLDAELRSGKLSRVNSIFSRGLIAALRFLSATRTFKGTVYRYLELNPTELHTFIEKYSVGKIITESAFTSANVIPGYVDTNVQLVIKSHTGVDISFEKLSPPFDQEQEVLFPPEVKFKVHKLIPGNSIQHPSNSRVKWTIEMEEVF